MIHFYRFMTEDIVFHELSTAPELFRTVSGNEEEGTRPLCLSNKDRTVISVYFPVRDECMLELPEGEDYTDFWLGPRTGARTEPSRCESDCFTTPETNNSGETWGDDRVLLLRNLQHLNLFE